MCVFVQFHPEKHKQTCDISYGKETINVSRIVSSYPVFSLINSNGCLCGLVFSCPLFIISCFIRSFLCFSCCLIFSASPFHAFLINVTSACFMVSLEPNFLPFFCDSRPTSLHIYDLVTSVVYKLIPQICVHKTS